MQVTRRESFETCWELPPNIFRKPAFRQLSDGLPFQGASRGARHVHSRHPTAAAAGDVRSSVATTCRATTCLLSSLFQLLQARHWRPPPVRTLLSPRSRHRRAARGTRRRVRAANGEVRDAPLSSITLSSSSFATPLRPVVIPSRPPVSSLVAVADSERRAPPTPSGRVGASV